MSLTERKPEHLIHQLWVQTLSLGVEVEVEVQWADQQLAVTEKFADSQGQAARLWCRTHARTRRTQASCL